MVEALPLDLPLRLSERFPLGILVLRPSRLSLRLPGIHVIFLAFLRRCLNISREHTLRGTIVCFLPWLKCVRIQLLQTEVAQVFLHPTHATF